VCNVTSWQKLFVLTFIIKQNMLRSSGHQAQKPHLKIYPSSPYFGGEMGEGVWKKHKMSYSTDDNSPVSK
jgi:hypothetical protein